MTSEQSETDESTETDTNDADMPLWWQTARVAVQLVVIAASPSAVIFAGKAAGRLAALAVVVALTVTVAALVPALSHALYEVARHD